MCVVRKFDLQIVFLNKNILAMRQALWPFWQRFWEIYSIVSRVVFMTVRKQSSSQITFERCSQVG